MPSTAGLIRCMGAAGVKDMTATDVLVLHHINHKGTEAPRRHLLRPTQHRGHARRFLLAEEAGRLVEGSKRGKEVSSRRPPPAVICA